MFSFFKQKKKKNQLKHSVILNIKYSDEKFQFQLSKQTCPYMDFTYRI